VCVCVCVYKIPRESIKVDVRDGLVLGSRL